MLYLLSVFCRFTYPFVYSFQRKQKTGLALYAENHLNLTSKSAGEYCLQRLKLLHLQLTEAEAR